MKTKRNFLALMLSVCMAVQLLAGCGSNESGAIQSSAPPASASTSASSLAVTPEPAEPESPVQGRNRHTVCGDKGSWLCRIPPEL